MLRLSAVLGNTTCRFALMEETECIRELVLTHEDSADPSALAAKLSAEGMQAARQAVLCSVVPPLRDAVVSAMQAVSGAAVHEIRPESFTTMPIRYDTPESLGMDRVCGALAARERCGAPVLAVDCGTATTVNIVDPAGDFLGGWIVPGIQTALDVLHVRTAQLPGLPPGGASGLYGRDTESSIRNGVLQQTRLAIMGLAGVLADEWKQQMTIMLTGGNSPFLFHEHFASEAPQDTKTRISLLRQGGRDALYLQYDANLVHRGTILCLLFE